MVPGETFPPAAALLGFSVILPVVDPPMVSGLKPVVWMVPPPVVLKARVPEIEALLPATSRAAEGVAVPIPRVPAK